MASDGDVKYPERLLDLMAEGVPWWLAKEAIASTNLDRDQTYALDEPPC